MIAQMQSRSREREAVAAPGATMLVVSFLLFWAAILSAIAGGALTLLAVLLWPAWFLHLFGFFVVEPNGSRVLVLFGTYKATIKRNGFYWTNPFMTKKPISLRARTLNGEKLKVNDLVGNPIEIAAVVMWRVSDTYSACFEVENYEEFVAMQSETAIRHLASTHPYDADDETVPSLRRNAVVICDALQAELQERLGAAGVTVMEARLSHLAYAPEIASAMLRRQQAAAVIAARQRIVEGAVGMVEMALQRLEEHKIVEMDADRKAAMVANLLVVLCGESAAQPIVNTSVS